MIMDPHPSNPHVEQAWCHPIIGKVGHILSVQPLANVFQVIYPQVHMAIHTCSGNWKHHKQIDELLHRLDNIFHWLNIQDLYPCNMMNKWHCEIIIPHPLFKVCIFKLMRLFFLIIHELRMLKKHFTSINTLWLPNMIWLKVCYSPCNFHGNRGLEHYLKAFHSNNIFFSMTRCEPKFVFTGASCLNKFIWTANWLRVVEVQKHKQGDVF